MTLRQTVAGASPSEPLPQGQCEQGPLNRFNPPPKPAAPQIQSIRHTPLPTRASDVDARTSMTEILAQQQFEKTVVKEAVAKRSLQEIQQEQEFQAWWDNESKRVQEEEEAQASPAAARRGKEGRGRGGHHRGGGRGKATSAAGAGGQQKKQSSTDSSVTTRVSRSGRGNGTLSRGSANSGRGPGRGDAHQLQRGARASILINE